MATAQQAVVKGDMEPHGMSGLCVICSRVTDEGYGGAFRLTAKGRLGKVAPRSGSDTTTTSYSLVRLRSPEFQAGAPLLRLTMGSLWKGCVCSTSSCQPVYGIYSNTKCWLIWNARELETQ